MLEEKKRDLLKQIARLTTLPKKNSPLQWEFQEGHFNIYGFRATFKGNIYSCFFDPAEGYCLSIYEEGKGTPTLTIQGFCFKTYFEKIFAKAWKQCPQAVAAYQKKGEEETKRNQQKIKQIEQKEAKTVNEALKQLIGKS